MKTIFVIPFIILFGISGVTAHRFPYPDQEAGGKDENSIIWFDPRNEPFDLVGFEWIKADQVYRRLPLKPDWEIRKEVDNLANNTAGGQIRFRTDSKKILLRVELMHRPGSLYHMPATGVSGFDLYIQDGTEQRYVRTVRFSLDTTYYETELYVAGTKELHNFTINFPLYNGVNSVSVGIDEGAQLLAPPSFRRPGKFVIYGTSITQGGCVSRPGMAYSNILSRKLDAEFVNLGFSGNGRGEPELARLISQVSDIGFIILDYEANAGESITNSLGPFVDILREKHPTTHILIISKIRYANATDGSQAYKSWMANRDFQKNLVSERNKKGDKRIFFLDGSTILGDDYFECTVDGVHPTDLGSLRIADAIQPVIEKILSKSK